MSNQNLNQFGELGDRLKTIIDDGVNSQDYQKMTKEIKNTVNDAVNLAVNTAVETGSKMAWIMCLEMEIPTPGCRKNSRRPEHKLLRKSESRSVRHRMLPDLRQMGKRKCLLFMRK